MASTSYAEEIFDAWRMHRGEWTNAEYLLSQIGAASQANEALRPDYEYAQAALLAKTERKDKVSSGRVWFQSYERSP
jgi:hypothetical protein